MWHVYDQRHKHIVTFEHARNAAVLMAVKGEGAYTSVDTKQGRMIAWQEGVDGTTTDFDATANHLELAKRHILSAYGLVPA